MRLRYNTQIIVGRKRKDFDVNRTYIICVGVNRKRFYCNIHHSHRTNFTFLRKIKIKENTISISKNHQKDT